MELPDRRSGGLVRAGLPEAAAIEGSSAAAAAAAVHRQRHLRGRSLGLGSAGVRRRGFCLLLPDDEFLKSHYALKSKPLLAVASHPRAY